MRWFMYYCVFCAGVHTLSWALSPLLYRPLQRWWYVRNEFKLADLWLGVYWSDGEGSYRHLYVCLVPCFPIHIRWKRSYK